MVFIHLSDPHGLHAWIRQELDAFFESFERLLVTDSFFLSHDVLPKRFLLVSGLLESDKIQLQTP